MSKHDKTMQTMQIMTVIYARTKHHQPCLGINIKRRRHYPPDVKRTIYAKLLEKSNPGMMKEGVTKSVANEMGVPLRVVQRVWRHRQIGDGIEAFESKKKKYCGHKKLPFDPSVIQDVPLGQRHSIRDLANALHMAKATLFRRLKEGLFRRHTNAIKFTLTEDNMKARVHFCIQMLDS